MQLTLGQAAKRAGVNKSTLSRWLRKGRISGQKQDNGSWMIDASEIDRIIQLQGCSNGTDTPDLQQSVTPRNPDLLIENRELVAKLEAVLEREQLKDGIIDELRTDRDHWRQQATALLTDQRPKEDRDRQEPPAKADAEQKAGKREQRSLVQILFGFPPRKR